MFYTYIHKQALQQQVWSPRPTSWCSLRRLCLLCSLVSRASTCCDTTSATCSRALCSARSSTRRARSYTARSPRGPDLATLHFYFSQLFDTCLKIITPKALIPPPIPFSRLCSFYRCTLAQLQPQFLVIHAL